MVVAWIAGSGENGLSRQDAFLQKELWFPERAPLTYFILYDEFLKLLVWCIGLLVPSRNDQAKKELRSNLDVMMLCLNLK